MRHLITALALVVGLAAPAAAEEFSCAPLRSATAVDDVNAAANEADVPLIQAGVRSIFGPEDGLLSDGFIGPVTTENIADLCDLVPLPEGSDAIAGTLAVSREFGLIDELRYGAPLLRGDHSRLDIADPDAFGRRVVRFGGSAAKTCEMAMASPNPPRLPIFEGRFSGSRASSTQENRTAFQAGGCDQAEQEVGEDQDREGLDVVAGARELEREQSPDVRLVVDDEDGRAVRPRGPWRLGL